MVSDTAGHSHETSGYAASRGGLGSLGASRPTGARGRLRDAKKDAADMQAKRAKGLKPDDARHGTANGYQNWGCRCGPCTEAHSTYHRVRKGGSPPKNETPKYGVKTSTNNRSEDDDGREVYTA